MNRQRAVAIGILVVSLCSGAWTAQAQAQKTLTLEAAIARALERNEQPRIAEQRAVAAEAREDRARSFFYPDLTATGTYLFRPDPAVAVNPVSGMEVELQERHALSGVLALNVNLLDLRAFPLYRQAGIEREAAVLRASESARVLAFDVSRAYLTVLGVEQLQQAAERRVALAERILDGAKGRFEAGLSSSNDVTRADLEMASAKRELARTRGDVQSARLQLSYLIGADVTEELVTPTVLLDPGARPTQDPKALSEQAQKRRKDLAAAAKDKEAADAAAEEPLMRWFPSLGLTAQYRVTSEEGISGRQTDAFAGVQLTWVLWDGGERIADRDERLANSAASELQMEALSRRIGIDVRQALNLLDRGKAEAAEAEVAAEAARKNSVESYVLYKQGLLPALAAADAALQLFAAEVELVRAQYGVATALLDLRAALGVDPFGREPR